MPRRARTLLIALLTVAALVAGSGAAHAGGDYSDPAYLRHDLDNMSRSSLEGRQLAEALSLQYGYALTPNAAETFLTNLGRQVTDLPQGRIYATLGQLLPGGAVGNPLTYASMTPRTVAFLSRTGASSSGASGPTAGPGPTPAS